MAIDMGKGRNITTRVYISIHGAPEEPWESLTPEMQKYCGEQLALRMRDAIQDYYSGKPEEWNELCDELDRKKSIENGI